MQDIIKNLLLSLDIYYSLNFFFIGEIYID